MTTITGKIKAWIVNGTLIGPEDIAAASPDLIGRLSYSQGDMGFVGWTLAGEAEVTLTLVDRDILITNKVESLRNEVTKTRAEAQAKVTKLEGQIQKLLAITNEVQ